jgi:hypothetical protein
LETVVDNEDDVEDNTNGGVIVDYGDKQIVHLNSEQQTFQRKYSTYRKPLIK